jgi:diguanylate cyclase (GGDEF)-like protein
MRNDTRTAHIPMLILTARSGARDIVTGFENGADDYIAKPFDISELLARVKSHLRRATQRPVLSPLTGLPGGVLLSQELRHRLSGNHPVALLYADIDNFKAFNDIYGFANGDRAIQFVADLAQQILASHGNPDDFLGHIGGDDFAIITTPDRIDSLCRALIDAFDREVLLLYSPADRKRGYISAADRYGILRRFSMMSISIGVVTTERRRIRDEEALTRIAAEMKHYAKEQPGSSYAVDQRVQPQSSAVERRSVRNRGVLIASDDASLRSVLRATLQDNGYIAHEATTIEALRRQLGAVDAPALVLADAQLGGPLWTVCAAQARELRGPAILVLAYDEGELAQARAAGAAECLQLPVPLADIITAVERLTSRAKDSHHMRSVGTI